MAYLSIKDPGPNKLQLFSKLRSFLRGLSTGDLTRLVEGKMETHLAKPSTMSEVVWGERLDDLVDLLEDQGATYELDECGCDVGEEDKLPPAPLHFGQAWVNEQATALEDRILHGKVTGLGGLLN